MHRLLFSIVLSITVSTSGCSSHPIHIWHTDTQDLIQEHNYKKAINQVHAEKPVNQTLLKKIYAKAKQHLKLKSQLINQFVIQKEWGQAREVLRYLGDTQPIHTHLVDLEGIINQAQKEEERLLNTRLHLIESDLLDYKFKKQAFTDRVHHNRFNWFDQTFSLEERKKQLAEKLLQLSTQAIIVKDYTSAQLTYAKAVKLNQQLSHGEIKKAINTGLSSIGETTILLRQRALITQLTSAISNLNFNRLLKVENILSHEPFHGAKVEKALKQAHNLRHEYAQSLDKNAAKLYRKGDISKSVEQWLMAAKLDPNNISIQEKLLRAQKVLRKLNSLSSGTSQQLYRTHEKPQK